MGRALWIADELRRRGLDVVEHPGWRKRGAAVFNPQAVVCHHTASARGSDAPSLGIVVDGRSKLPGPLCNVLLTRSGVAIVVASGRANHAGAGGFRGLTGNSSVLGIEAENDGVGEPWPDVQLDAYRRVVAGLLTGIGRDPSACCGHREWAPKRKIDPAGIDMDTFRAQVGALLAGQQPPVQPKERSGGTPVDGGAGTIRAGDSGPAVIAWQSQLVSIGATITVDGDFGPATERATKEFQASSGLEPDGVVGPRTREAMAARATSAPDGQVLRRGDSGPAVAAWQTQLVSRGATLKVDGDFGPATEKATKDFQSASGLEADGIVGPKTRAAMASSAQPV